MNQKQNYLLMAEYNSWMNEKIYSICKQIPHEKLHQNLGAFFLSIIGTLNHILVADIIWLKRFSDHPKNYSSLDYIRSIKKPHSLNQIIYDRIEDLTLEREKIDQIIKDFILEITEEDLENSFSYKNMKGEHFNKKFSYIILHFFNHQTHHRGQVSTLLSQLNLELGITDLLVLIPSFDLTS